MATAWLLLNTMSFAMARTYSEHAGMAHSVMHQLDIIPEVDVGSPALQQAQSAHGEHADMLAADDATMDDCMSFACCVITREISESFQSYRYLSTLNYEMRSPAFLIGLKPGSTDRPPKIL